MKKILIGLVFVLLIVGCGRKEVEVQNGISTEIPIEEVVPEAVAEQISPLEDSCNELEGQAKQDCFDIVTGQKVSSLGDVSICAEISSEILKSECKENFILNRAVLQDNVDICKGTLDEEKCISNFYSTKAMSELNLEYCGQIKSQDKTVCEENVLMEMITQGMEINCNEITIEELKSQCKLQKVIQKVIELDDVNLCNELMRDSKGQCIDNYYVSKAMFADDISLCDKVASIDNCKDNFYFNKGFTDQTFCDKIKAEDLKKICKGEAK